MSRARSTPRLIGGSRLSPGLKGALAELRRLSSRDTAQLSQTRVNVLEQRDAVALGLEIAGIDSRAALDSHEATDDVPFLRGLANATAHEAAILRHDASRFEEWMEVSAEHVDVWRYVDPEQPARRVTVLYADKGPLEVRTGTDLIYYREETKAFVLVQYKRMKSTGQGRRIAYRPDKQLEIEIARMEDLELVDTPATTVDEARLSSAPFYMKLVEPDINRPQENKLAKGMYFPLELFQLVRADPATQGPKGGAAIGWDNARRYLTNGQFVALVQDSWIGTRGDATIALSQIIQDALAGDRGVVVVDDHTESRKVFRRRS